jgi:hypothetical protein
VRTDQ